MSMVFGVFFFFFKQKTAYEMRISDWSSDVCSSDLYVGAMLVGALIRNLDDASGWIRLSVPTIELIGNICLALFLALALMNLKLWELAGLATPLLVNLGLQALIVVAFCAVVFRAMGRDYDAAVMRSEEHTSELQSLMRISYAVFCLKKKNNKYHKSQSEHAQ